MDNHPRVSLIIPAFNEERRIGEGLDKILHFFRSQPYSFEIIVVDDGSRDRTAEVVRERCPSYPNVKVYRQERNAGKGWAVRRGMLAAQGQYLFFSDADLSVPIETLPKFLAELENHCDMAVGSRQLPGARIAVPQPYYRAFLGKIYTRLANWILGLRISDVTCGFKGLRKEAARELFSRQQLGNWSFDAEILYLARHRGYRIREIPVLWRNDSATKVKLWRDVLTSFLGLLQIRLYRPQGRY